MMQGVTGVNSQTRLPITQITPSKYSPIMAKIKSGQGISSEAIGAVLDDLLNSNSDLAARNISDVLIAAIDPASPSRPNKNENVKNSFYLMVLLIKLL